jgi:molybdopterin/thiamine biosynthesis adenylyltransferase
MSLSEIEKERYNRHLIIDGFAEENQLKLKNAKVLVVGAGGLGCPVIQYLVAAGVGTVGIFDGDVVSLSNLQRQILFTEEEVGQSKAVISASKMSKLNSQVSIHIYNVYLTNELADDIFPTYDIVIGCTDNFYSRYIINNYSKMHNLPFIHGSIGGYEGQFCVFNYPEGISYSDIFGDIPPESTDPVGVIGALPGIIGSLMALEAIKIITNQGEIHSDKLLIFDALTNSFRHLKLS